MPIIRPAHSWDDYLQCEEIQRRVWHSPDNRDIVPASLLITAHKNGGVLLCASDGPAMAGFVFGFTGIEGQGADRRIKHCSHMLAVLSEYRGRGLAVELKKAQRLELIENGFDLATWTYDPLQALNAQLNLARLGAIARRYIVNAYGELSDELNAGTDSDRFEVEWWIKSARVVKRMAGNAEGPLTRPDAPVVYDVEFDGRGLPRVMHIHDWPGESAWVEIPASLSALRLADLGLARAWRDWTRTTFRSAFAQGFVAIDAASWNDEAGRPRAGYLLAEKPGILDL